MIADNKKICLEDMNPGFFLISPISIENEIKMLKYIEDKMTECLKLYKTTYEVNFKIIFRKI